LGRPKMDVHGSKRIKKGPFEGPMKE